MARELKDLHRIWGALGDSEEIGNADIQEQTEGKNSVGSGNVGQDTTELEASSEGGAFVIKERKGNADNSDGEDLKKTRHRKGKLTQMEKKAQSQRKKKRIHNETT